MGLYHSSVIIITSDHGELLGEHGFYHHSTPMYEGVIKIPLVIKFPYSKRVEREKRMITLVDLYPTILSICQMPIPDGISGKAIGNAPSHAVSELYKYETGKQRILYDGEYKYMSYEHTRPPELYKMNNDPKEKENLSGKLPEVTSTMVRKLKSWEETHRPKHTSSTEQKTSLSKEVLEELKALGYIQ